MATAARLAPSATPLTVRAGGRILRASFVSSEPAAFSPSFPEDWLREAARLHRRYLVEIVEHFNFCPWAVKARAAGRLRVAVLLQTGDSDLEPSLRALAPWSSDAGMEVGFLLYPRLPPGRVAFDAFTARVREAFAARRPLGDSPFALVAFHPDAAPDLAEAERLIPFLRRTPDPCVQVVRIDVLDRVRGAAPEGTQFLDLSFLDRAAALAPEPTLRERVSRANLGTVAERGVAAVDAVFADILRDREATYRALEAARRT